MKGLLGLSADFIDRMTNAAHGEGVNEAYCCRFAELLQSDESLAYQLSAGDLSESDTGLLSMQSWLWYLRWVATQEKLPSDGFLNVLYEDASDSLLRLVVLDSVMTHPVIVQRYSDIPERQTVHLEELPPSWPRDLILALISPELADSLAIDARPAGQIAEIVEVSFSLLQIGNTPAMVILRGLLAYPWPYRGEVVQAVDHWLQSSEISGVELDRWRDRLGLRAD
ncbi:hypothetical protein [Kitasatospora sp. NPDC090091]|uniref:hypothetical protein n=1 Tax=Kitasatospora sp. NPDC090091 TaxID=3364081 RepID=UPI003817B0C3